MTLSDNQLSHFKSLLLKQKTGLLEADETGEQAEAVVELDQTRVGRLSRMDAMQAQAMAKASSQRREQMLKQITGALARIENNDFGYCRDCEELIPIKRLEFDPTSTRCVECASAAES